ncbi:MAG: septation regulator SpoVG [bacterium]
MDITEVKVYPVRKPDDKLKAFVTIILDDCFVIRDMKVINGNSGLFVAMPSRKKADGTYADIAHPLNSDMRKRMEELVIREYKTVIAQNPNAGSRSEDDDPDAHLR